MIHSSTPSQQTPAPISRAFIRHILLRIATLAAMVALLAAPAALLSGCIFVDGTSPGSSSGSGSSMSGGSSMSSGSGMSSGSSMNMPTAPVPRLPQPDVWRVELPVLDADAQKRLDEVDQYLWDQYQAVGWQIMTTTQGWSGDVFDWLNPASVEGSQVEPPPTPTPEELQLPDGVQLQLTELDLFPELRGSDGTIPVLRPSFAAYVLGLSGATSLDDYLTNYQVLGLPTDPNRLYAGIDLKVPNLGAATFVNAFGGLIEPGTLSVLEMVAGCRDPNNPVTGEMWEQIGIAASRDWTTNGLLSGNFGDSVLRLQVEFLIAGPKAIGGGKGGWEEQFGRSLKPPPWRPYPPGTTLMPSTIGGPQYQSHFGIKLWHGDWWVSHNGNWLGYYPGTKFKQMASKACEVLWYGEVYDPKSTPTTWTWTDMGSGQFAYAGWGNAASFRNPVYFDISDLSQWPDNASDISNHNDACYTKTNLSAGQAPWDRWFYVGGPGGDALNLDCPVSH